VPDLPLQGKEECRTGEKVSRRSEEVGGKERGKKGQGSTTVISEEKKGEISLGERKRERRKK